MFVFKRGSVLVKNEFIIFILFILTINYSNTIDSSSHSDYQHNNILTETVIDKNKEHKEQLETLNNGQQTETVNEIVKQDDGVILDNDNDNMKLDTNDNANSDSDPNLLEEEIVREEERVSVEHTVMADSNDGTVLMDSDDDNGENGESNNGEEDSSQEREEKKNEKESIEVDDSQFNNNKSNQDISSDDGLVLDNGTINDIDDEEQSDDIVTFEEFKNKMNQEVVNTKPTGGPPVLLRQAYHNYALSECGAKVLESNKEAKNAGSILLANKDLYMLNPCSANVWFVIELCELVSVSILEISCFELFSSLPETIAVYTSDSYPNPVWEKLGIFTLSDERGSQKFPFEETVYTKFIKFEMLTHFGSEHYCPISTVKVLGSTMIEEYEFTESQRDGGKHQRNEEISERIIQNEDGTSDSSIKGNPIKVATDAILSVIGQAVNGLISPDDDDDDNGGLDDKLDSENDMKSSTDNNKFTDSEEFDEHHSQQIQKEDLMNIPVNDNDPVIEPTSPLQLDSLVSETVTATILNGVNAPAPTNVPLGSPSDNTIETQQSFITTTTTTLLMTEDIIKQVSQIESKTMHITIIDEVTTSSQSSDNPSQVIDPLSSLTGTSSKLEVDKTIEEKGNMVSQTQSTLKPTNSVDTETTGPQYTQNVSNSSNSSNGVSHDIGMQVDTTVNDTYITTTATNNVQQDNTVITTDEATNTNNDTENSTIVSNINGIDTTVVDESGDSSINDCTGINATVNNSNVSTGSNKSVNVSSNKDSVTEEPNDNGNGSNGTSHTAGAREKSIFVRLSNRINVLEINMTLFDSYLDQISQSLKKNKNRTEDMQRTLERRMGVLNETVQFIRGQIHLNVSLLDMILSSLAELNHSFLYQNHEWNIIEDSILMCLLIIICLQTITIISCCFLQLNKSNRITGMQKSLQLIETQLTDLSLHIKGNEKPSNVKLKGRQTTINGVSNRMAVDDDNTCTKRRASTNIAVTINGGEPLHTSLSTPNLTSISSLSQEESRENSIKKWKKVENKRHKKSSFKKAEQ